MVIGMEKLIAALVAVSSIVAGSAGAAVAGAAAVGGCWGWGAGVAPLRFGEGGGRE